MRHLPVTVESTADCRSGTAFFGAVADDNELWYPVQKFVLELTEQTSLHVETDDNASVRIEICVESCANTPDWKVVNLDEQTGFGQTTFEAMFSAGRYIVTVRPLDVSLPFSAVLRMVR